MSLKTIPAAARMALIFTDYLRLACVEGVALEAGGEVTKPVTSAADYDKAASNTEPVDTTQGFKDGPRAHLIALIKAIQAEPFQALTFWNGWVPTPGTGARVDALGVVMLRGAVNGGTGTIALLPVEARPPYEHRFAIASSGGPAILIVKPNGEISASGAGSTVYLDGVTFKV